MKRPFRAHRTVFKMVQPDNYADKIKSVKEDDTKEEAVVEEEPDDW